VQESGRHDANSWHYVIAAPLLGSIVRRQKRPRNLKWGILLDRFGWAVVILVLLSIPVAAFSDWRNMRPERFKNRAEKWMRDLKNNPHHLPLDPNADTTKWPNLIVAGSIAWLLMLLTAITQFFRSM
jgi:hypothetical protein